MIFDFSTGIKKNDNIKLISFCDWTIDYEITMHQKRQASRLEKKSIKKQNAILLKSDYIFSLFPNSTDFMKKQLSNVYYVGNGINSEVNYNVSNAIKNRYENNNILFIGRNTYQKGLNTLVDAVIELNDRFGTNYHLNIVGNLQEYRNESSYVKYYGYLDKDVEEQSRIYDELLKSSKLFVNVNDNWIGAQSLLEALYNRIPVIINKNDDLINMFGENIDFGFWSGNNKDDVKDKLLDFNNLSFDKYNLFSLNAYKVSQPYSWENVVKKMKKIIES